MPIEELNKVATEVCPGLTRTPFGRINVQCQYTNAAKQACDTTLTDVKEYDHTKVGDWNSGIIVRLPTYLPTTYPMDITKLVPGG